jgi:hypothetical protein
MATAWYDWQRQPDGVYRLSTTAVVGDVHMLAEVRLVGQEITVSGECWTSDGGDQLEVYELQLLAYDGTFLFNTASMSDADPNKDWLWEQEMENENQRYPFSWKHGFSGVKISDCTVVRMKLEG